MQLSHFRAKLRQLLAVVYQDNCRVGFDAATAWNEELIVLYCRFVLSKLKKKILIKSRFGLTLFTPRKGILERFQVQLLTLNKLRFLFNVKEIAICVNFLSKKPTTLYVQPHSDLTKNTIFFHFIQFSIHIKFHLFCIACSRLERISLEPKLLQFCIVFDALYSVLP